jgi:hypothetical protein
MCFALGNAAARGPGERRARAPRAAIPSDPIFDGEGREVNVC